MTGRIISNYIRQCVQHCPDNVQMLFGDINANTKLQLATESVVQFTDFPACFPNNLIMTMELLVGDYKLYMCDWFAGIHSKHLVRAMTQKWQCIYFISNMLKPRTSSPKHLHYRLQSVYYECEQWHVRRSVLLKLSRFNLIQGSTNSQSIRCVFLAVLHYRPGQHETEIKYCRLCQFPVHTMLF